MPFFSKRPPLTTYSDDLDDEYGLASYWTWLMPLIVMTAFVVTAVLCR